MKYIRTIWRQKLEKLHIQFWSNYVFTINYAHKELCRKLKYSRASGTLSGRCAPKIWDDCAGITNSAAGVPLLPAQYVRQRMGNWGLSFLLGALHIIFPLAEIRSLLFKQIALRLPFKQRVRRCSTSWSWFTFPVGTQRSTEEYDVQELGTRHKAGSSEAYQERHCVGNWLLKVIVYYINQPFIKILK